MAIRSDDRVLVTGAASGLGLALVKGFVRRGCRVLATDLAEQRPAVLDDLPGVSYERLDVRDDQRWQSVHGWVAEVWRGLDILVNNAGVAASARLELTTTEHWQRVLDIDLLGVTRGCRTFAPMFQAQRCGRIVNIASAAGLVHPARTSEYAAAKAGVVAVSESLRYELAAYGVGVSAVCPTFFRTNLGSSLGGQDPEADQYAEKLISGAKYSAETISARVLDGVDAGRPLILTDRDGRVAYYAKRFARPLYDAMMLRAAKRMASYRETSRR